MRIAISLIGLAATASIAAAQTASERYLVIENGERIGHLIVTRNGTRVDTDFLVSDNGRGPKIRESWQLGQDGLPRQLTLAGTTTYGSPAKESFRWQGSRVVWQSINDRGSAAVSGPAMYLPIDGSPYFIDLYLPALLVAPEHKLAAWPSGSVRAERVRDITLAGTEGKSTVWALWGLDLSPVFVLAGPDGRWAGMLSSDYVLLPEAWEKSAKQLSQLAVSVENELLATLTTRLTHHWDRPVQLRNVRVLDPATGTLSQPTSVVTYGGRITTIAPDFEPPDSVVSINGEGGTLVPGLFDLHGHYGAWQGPLELAAGVTTVRDMGNDNEVLAATLREIDSGKLMGPRIVRSGFIEGRTPYSARGGFVVASLPEALQKVRWYGERGFYQIKIYNSINPDWVAPMAAEAHRLGMRVAGHVPAFSSSPRVVRDGYDEVTHINQLILSFLINTDKEDTRTPFRFTALGQRAAKLSLDDPRLQQLIAEMKKKGVGHDPTIATFQSLMLARPGTATVVDAPWLDHMPGPIQRSRKVALLDIKPNEDAVYRASSQKLRDVLKLLFDRGITLVPGTDDVPGVMLDSELEEWQRSGIPAKDVIRLATIGAAEHLGLDRELGTITRGKRADYLLVPGDPTQDVSVLRKARLVMKDGAVYFPDELHSAIGVTPFGTRPAMQEQLVP
jgi:amidohydrolase family protein